MAKRRYLTMLDERAIRAINIVAAANRVPPHKVLEALVEPLVEAVEKTDFLKVAREAVERVVARISEGEKDCQDNLPDGGDSPV